MKKILLSLSLAILSVSAKSQTTAMDFTQDDCNGNSHHLFQDLEEGNVVILEFFMTNCGSCIVAGNNLEIVKGALLESYPNKVKSYAIGFSNSYTSSQVLNWVNSNSFTSYPMTTGASQVAYYGGMGMPTVVVLGGNNHEVLAGPFLGLSGSDTTEIGTKSRAYLELKAGIQNLAKEIQIEIYPNPSNDLLTLNFPFGGKRIESLTVTDLNGKVVYSKLNFKTEETKINTTSFQSGLYIINVISENVKLNESVNIIH